MAKRRYEVYVDHVIGELYEVYAEDGAEAVQLARAEREPARRFDEGCRWRNAVVRCPDPD